MAKKATPQLGIFVLKMATLSPRSTPSISSRFITSFTFKEDQRIHLYNLHLALVMNTECYYRNYDTDEIFNMSMKFIETEMIWLKEN